jgi:hypothetical protein
MSFLENCFTNTQLMKGGHFTIGHDKGGFDLSKPPYQLWKWKLIG